MGNINENDYEKKCQITKQLYINLKRHVGNVSIDFSMEEWYLKKIVSDLTIKFLIDYNTDNNYIFPDFSCWKMLYTIVGDD